VRQGVAVDAGELDPDEHLPCGSTSRVVQDEGERVVVALASGGEGEGSGVHTATWTHNEGMPELAGIHPDYRGGCLRYQPLLSLTDALLLAPRRLLHAYLLASCHPETAEMRVAGRRADGKRSGCYALRTDPRAWFGSVQVRDPGTRRARAHSTSG
jgi:hypothetical protein